MSNLKMLALIGVAVAFLVFLGGDLGVGIAGMLIGWMLGVASIVLGDEH